jgi:predicted GNAT family acetyltransferase
VSSTSGDATIAVEVVTAAHMHDLADFAEGAPLVRADFASLAMMQAHEPRILGAWRGGMLVAAAIDDGLAMSIAGDGAGLRAIAARIPDLASKLVIAGRAVDVAAIESLVSNRYLRPEHFMTITQDKMLVPAEPIPLRVATPQDLPVLEQARLAALEEEYGIHVPRGSSLHNDLHDAVARAVDMHGVAIWVDDERIAFTAQLIAKTPTVAMFGDLYTDPALRGRGRATRALAAFCTWLMTESTHVALRVGTDNERAIRLYERVGFQVVDTFASSLRPMESASSTAPGN